MSMTLLELCQTFAKRTGLPTGSSVEVSPVFRQLSGLLQEVLDDLVTTYSFQELTVEAQFTTVAALSQGALSAIAPLGFLRIRPKTFFNRTTGLEVPGPLTPSEAQALRTQPQTGPISWYRIVGGQLRLDPVPAAGQFCAFEYMSTFSVVGPAPGLTPKQYPTDGADTFLLPDQLLLAGLRWRWKAEKGFDYAEEFAAYQLLAKSLAANSEAGRPLQLDGQYPSARPGIVVPSGTWISP